MLEAIGYFDMPSPKTWPTKQWVHWYLFAIYKFKLLVFLSIGGLFYIISTIKTLLKIKSHSHNILLLFWSNHLFHTFIIIVWSHYLFLYVDPRITLPTKWWLNYYLSIIYNFKLFIVSVFFLSICGFLT